MFPFCRAFHTQGVLAFLTPYTPRLTVETESQQVLFKIKLSNITRMPLYKYIESVGTYISQNYAPILSPSSKSAPTRLFGTYTF